MPTPFFSRPCLLLCLSGLLCGCTSMAVAPRPADGPSTPAEALRVLPAWDALATDLAERIVNRLSEIPVTPAAAATAHPPTEGATTPSPAPTLATATFQLQAQPASAFDQALLTLLTQRLLSLGLTFEALPAAGQIALSTQLIPRGQRPPMLLLSTQVHAQGRLQASTADLYVLDAAELPLFTASAQMPPAPVKTWRMVTP